MPRFLCYFFFLFCKIVYAQANNIVDSIRTLIDRSIIRNKSSGNLFELTSHKHSVGFSVLFMQMIQFFSTFTEYCVFLCSFYFNSNQIVDIYIIYTHININVVRNNIRDDNIYVSIQIYVLSISQLQKVPKIIRCGCDINDSFK